MAENTEINSILQFLFWGVWIEDAEFEENFRGLLLGPSTASGLSKKYQNPVPEPTCWLKWISTNFPKRLLLLLRTVFALPKASSRGLAVQEERRKRKLLKLQEVRGWSWTRPNQNRTRTEPEPNQNRTGLTFHYPLINILTGAVGRGQVPGDRKQKPSVNITNEVCDQY